MAELNVGSTGILRATNVQATDLNGNKSLVTDAATFTIYDLAGVAVTGQTWPTSLTLISDGNYAGYVESDCNLEAGQRYKAVISVGSDVFKRHVWTKFFVVGNDG